MPVMCKVNLGMCGYHVWIRRMYRKCLSVLKKDVPIVMNTGNVSTR